MINTCQKNPRFPVRNTSRGKPVYTASPGNLPFCWRWLQVISADWLCKRVLVPWLPKLYGSLTATTRIPTRACLPRNKYPTKVVVAALAKITLIRSHVTDSKCSAYEYSLPSSQGPSEAEGMSEIGQPRARATADNSRRHWAIVG